MIIEYSKSRLKNIIDEVQKLSSNKPARKEITTAYTILNSRLSKHEQRLDQLQLGEKGFEGQCEHILRNIHTCTKVIGCLLDAIDVANSFEVIGPLNRLANCLLSKNSGKVKWKLVISSEWTYSPQIKKYGLIDDFIFLSLPAPEIGNPLLLPLVGHELGHVIWDEIDLSSSIKKIIAEEFTQKYPDFDSKRNLLIETGLLPSDGTEASVVKNLFSTQSFDGYILDLQAEITERVLLQAEEIYSDIFGLYLFGESFLNAFSYMFSPNISTDDDPEHPDTCFRVEHLNNAAKKYNIIHDDRFIKNFIFHKNEGKPSNYLSKYETFLSQQRKSYLDKSASSIFVDSVSRYIDSIKKFPFARNDKHVASIVKSYRFMVPYEKTNNIIDILNAGWNVFLDKDFWNDEPLLQKLDSNPAEKYHRRKNILFDLILKNIEILEINQLLGDANAS